MACTHVDNYADSKLILEIGKKSIYREDCTQCFDSIDDPDGLDVCLKCFNGGCRGDRHHSLMHSKLCSHPLVLNIRRSRKSVERDEPPTKMTKIVIAPAQNEADRYDTALHVKCFECDVTFDRNHPKLAHYIDCIMKANTSSRKEEIRAWEQRLNSCPCISELKLQQEAKRVIAPQNLATCADCDLKENLWLCLICGNLGCGRAQFGGGGGLSHGLAHYDATGHAVAVKLGSITPDGAADVYCYKCDDDTVDPYLSSHLEHWGIKLSERQKTEKSLTELQIEQNLTWQFSMSNDDGTQLKPVFGPGLTGIKNLGNSCYLASILQCLFDLPAFAQRYRTDRMPTLVESPADDLETQLCRMADGLLSGRYSRPDPNVMDTDDLTGTRHQKGLSPAILKHLIGRGHDEFSTMRQQDAFELLEHLFDLISACEHKTPEDDPTTAFRYVMEERLQCRRCKRVRYKNRLEDGVVINAPMERAVPGGPTEIPKFRAVTIQECLDRVTRPEAVELTCSGCGSMVGFTKKSSFKTLPEVLVINVQKMMLLNWVPTKVDVPVMVGDGPILLDKYLAKGVQADEELLPNDESDEGNPNADFLFQREEFLLSLLDDGLPLGRTVLAFHKTSGSYDEIMDWVFSDAGAALDHYNKPLEPPPVADDSGHSETAGEVERRLILESLGYTTMQARRALREGQGSVERAVKWLLDQRAKAGTENFEDDEVDGTSPSGTSATPASYEMQSIVCHKGTSIHAGHYVAYVRKNLAEGEWVLFNDEKVVAVPDVEEMSKHAYIYFFKRV